MVVNYKLFFVSIFIIALYSCKVKSPEAYANEFCDCMEENNSNLTKCNHIIDEAKEVHGEDNKEAHQKFQLTARQCLD